MRKIKVLMVNECSYLTTGYARYGHNLLSLLSQDERFEIAEMGTFFNPFDNKMDEVPWKFYPNIPLNATEEQLKEFGQDVSCNMGYALFDNIVLDHQSDIVITITDHWGQKFVNQSNYRKCFKSLWLTPHDASNQSVDFLIDMQDHNGVLTYSDWASEEIRRVAPKVNLLGTVTGDAAPEFCPMNKEDVKREFGIDPNSKFIGTTMRNQFRKLFPNLFSSFREFLDKSGREDVFLYVHSSFPDGSFNFPELLLKNGIGHKTLFTYICHNCKHVFPSFYTDIATCKRCGRLSGKMPNTHLGVEVETLAKIYNLFDCYVQYANSEGLGYPQIEAATSNIPLFSVNYSAMADVVKKVGGYPINVLAYNHEVTTGMLRAVPNDNHLVELLLSFMNKPESVKRLIGLKTGTLARKHFSWAKTAETWANAILSVASEKCLWNLPINEHIPAQYQEMNCSNTEYARWLIKEVAGKPEKLGSQMESVLVRDLNYGHATGANYRSDASEDSKLFNDNKMNPFDRKIAYEACYKLGNELRVKEQIRRDVIGL